MSRRVNFGMFEMQLLAFLKEIDDPRKDDADFINERAEAAAAESEQARLEGCTVAGAMERAHAVLMEGLYNETEEEEV